MARLAAYEASPHGIEDKRRREEQLDELARMAVRRWELELQELRGTIAADEQIELDRLKEANPGKTKVDPNDPRQLRHPAPILGRLRQEIRIFRKR